MWKFDIDLNHLQTFIEPRTFKPELIDSTFFNFKCADTLIVEVRTEFDHKIAYQSFKNVTTTNQFESTIG